MMKPRSVAVIGEVYVDHIFTDFDHVPLSGEEIFAEQYRREAGGGTVNTACALARLGHRVSIFGVLGKDEEPWLRSRIGSFGVNLDHVESSEHPNALTVSMSTKCDRSFLSYIGANRSLYRYVLLPETVAALSSVQHIHFAMPLEGQAANLLLPALQYAGCTLSIDPGWRKEWFLDLGSLNVLRRMDLFLPNESEARLLTGHTDPQQILHSCAALGLKNTVIKLGPRGAVAHEGGAFHEMPALNVHVIDTTGAGDAFDAGFIDAWLTGPDIQEQLRCACVCGSLSTRARGALDALPLREEMMAVMQEQLTL